jgi:hypothetical protein
MQKRLTVAKGDLTKILGSSRGAGFLRVAASHLTMQLFPSFYQCQDGRSTVGFSMASCLEDSSSFQYLRRIHSEVFTRIRLISGRSLSPATQNLSFSQW